MCGIYGYFSRGCSAISTEALSKMAKSLKHRGPDGSGIYFGNGMAIGNQRLSIIDVSGGGQPFYSDDRKIVVVQNGEVFNYLELAKELCGSQFECRTISDTEVILRLYERDGIDFVKRLNGMFAIAIYDGRIDKLHLIRDRVGVKPLYIHDDGEKVTFASEIKALIESGRCSAQMDEEALSHYLSFNYVPPPFTIFKDIWHLKPGHILTVSRSGKALTCWWRLSDVEAIQGKSESDWIEEFNHVLADSVRIRLRSEAPFGAFLSGGVDSSTVVGLMAQSLRDPIKTFCIGFTDPRFDESQFARAAALRFGANLSTKIVAEDMIDLWPKSTYYCDQPHGDLSFLPTYIVSKMAAENVKMVLTGDGGDELFAGYEKHQHFFQQDESFTMSEERFRLEYFKSISLFSGEDRPSRVQNSRGKQSYEHDSLGIALKLFDDVRHQDRINQVLYLDMMLLLPGNNLVKPDRMGMAASIEARTPFLDYRMVELAFRIPGNLKLLRGETKYIYKKAVAELIGNELTYRKKQMFTVPIGEWFKSSRRSYCMENQPYDLFERSSIKKIYEEHFSGQKNRTRELRALISLKHWFEIFIKKSTLPT